jgi:DNA-binding NarL/FixJ family response regulator
MLMSHPHTETTRDTTIRIVVAEDQGIVRAALCALLGPEPDMLVVGEASNGDEALTLVQILRPDVLLLDLVMPGKRSIEVIETLQQQPSLAILVLSGYLDDALVRAVFQAGAGGYLLKTATQAELIGAIRSVQSGGMPLQPQVAKELVKTLGSKQILQNSLPCLSKKETQVLAGLACGLSNQEIASKLKLGEQTIHTHISRILRKLEVSNRTQAVLRALRLGLIQLPTE